MVTSPIRGQNILDLFLTSNPTLIDKITVLPGLSDQVELNVRPKITKQVPRDIILHKKADRDQLKQSMRDFRKVAFGILFLTLSDFATADTLVL